MTAMGGALAPRSQWPGVLRAAVDPPGQCSCAMDLGTALPAAAWHHVPSRYWSGRSFSKSTTLPAPATSGRSRWTLWRSATTVTCPAG